MDRRKLNAFNALVMWSTMLSFGYDSSAQQFEQKLSAAGVRSPVKLFYEYKYPDGKTAPEYERWCQRLVYMLLVYQREQLTDPVAYLTRAFERGLEFYNGPVKEVAKMEAKKLFEEQHNIDKYLCVLTEEERLSLADEIEADIPKAYDAAVAQVEKLKELNPELASVRIPGDVQILDFLQGVTYGFAPEDIDYFLNTDMDVRNSETQEYETYLAGLGLRPTYVVSLDRLKKIVDAVRQSVVLNNNRNGIANG